ncbi:MAG: hypothetical protein RL095_875 [Verrucomicrobiota bacterium]|jgi:hypothetical protein
MGMVMSFYALSAKDAEAILAHPQRLGHVLGQPPMPYKPGLFARLFGAKETPPDPWHPGPIEDLYIDKAWDGVHFLLTGKSTKESVDDTHPLAFMLRGTSFKRQDIAALLSVEEVQEIHKAFIDIDPERLYELADPADFKAKDLYPSIWDEPKEECIGYVTNALVEVKSFFEHAAGRRQAVIYNLS